MNMKELLLIPAILAVFVYGDYIMKKIDTFLEENQRAGWEDENEHKPVD